MDLEGQLGSEKVNILMYDKNTFHFDLSFPWSFRNWTLDKYVYIQYKDRFVLLKVS